MYSQVVLDYNVVMCDVIFARAPSWSPFAGRDQLHVQHELRPVVSAVSAVCRP